MLTGQFRGSCCSSPGCCNSGQSADDAESSSKINTLTDKQAVSEAESGRKITIDFLYLDLEVCTRCKGTDEILEQAINETAQVLQAAGAIVIVNKINVISRELAITHKFVSSPTIRINGRDIAAEIRETQCESCGDLCGDSVDCRVWVYQGKEYTEPPKAMIINAILQTVYGTTEYGINDITENSGSGSPYELPENLKKFYDAMSDRIG